MMVTDQIRMMREIRQWSQEDMAEKLNISVSSYAKLERGETKLHLDKLEKIANIFDMDVLQFMQSVEKGVVFLMADNCTHANYNATYYTSNDDETDIEKLKLIIKHKDELLAQKEAELKSLRNVITLLQQSGLSQSQ